MPLPPGLGPGGVIINRPGTQAARIVNASNIPHNVAKLLTVPAGWFLTEPYTEVFARDDTTAVAYFEGPFSERDAFYQWCLGYAISLNIPVAGAQQFDQPGQFVGAVLDGGNFGKIVNNVGGAPGIINNVGTQPFLSRSPPAQHWRWPWMYAVSCELVKGQGAYGPDRLAALYDGSGNPLLDGNGNPVPPPHSIAFFDSATGSDGLSALVKVTYRSTEGLYEVLTDEEMLAVPDTKGELERWVVRERQPSVQFLPLQGQPITFYEGPAAGGQIPEQAKGVIEFLSELRYSWLDVPDVPWDAIKAAVGRVNLNPFDGAGNGAWPTYDPETLLMQAPKIKRHRTAVGRVSWDIDYVFIHRPNGWNKFPIGNTNGTQFGYYGASFDGTVTGPRPYGAAEFNDLFVPPAPVTYQ